MKNRVAKYRWGRHYYPRYVKDELDELEWAEVLEMGDVDAPWHNGWWIIYEGRWYCSRNDDRVRLLVRALKKERRKNGR